MYTYLCITTEIASSQWIELPVHDFFIWIPNMCFQPVVLAMLLKPHWRESSVWVKWPLTCRFPTQLPFPSYPHTNIQKSRLFHYLLSYHWDQEGKILGSGSCRSKSKNSRRTQWTWKTSRGVAGGERGWSHLKRWNLAVVNEFIIPPWSPINDLSRHAFVVS